jgi:hypothetical protein
MRLLATFAFLLCWISVVASARPLNPVSGQLASEFGCELDYEYYAPSDDKALATVILAHGFMRDLDTVRGWTQHWSSQNIATVIVSFCNSNLINGHHQRNAADLICATKSPAAGKRHLRRLFRRRFGRGRQHL